MAARPATAAQKAQRELEDLQLVLRARHGAGDALPGPSVDDPSVCVISTEELQSLVFTLGSGLSQLEADALRLYLEGSSYEQMAEDLGCDTKTIDNALQRVKRKILTHQKTRQVLL